MRKIGALAAGIAFAGAALVGSSTLAATAADTSSLAVLAENNGAVYYGARSMDGTWNRFVDLTTMAGAPTGVDHLAVASANGELHVLVTKPYGVGGQLFEGVLTPGGRWMGFTNVSTAAGAPMTNNWNTLHAAFLGRELHVFLRTADASGTLYEGVKYPTGAWTAFHPLNVPEHAVVGAAVTVNGVLNLFVVSRSGLYEATRVAGGSWSDFGLLFDAASLPRDFGSMAAVAMGSELHLLIANGGLYHTTRNAAGQWSSLEDITDRVGVPTESHPDGSSGHTATYVAAAGTNTDLHVLITTGRSAELYHATWSSSSGAWTRLENVTDIVSAHGYFIGAAMMAVASATPTPTPTSTPSTTPSVSSLPQTGGGVPVVPIGLALVGLLVLAAAGIMISIGRRPQREGNRPIRP